MSRAFSIRTWLALAVTVLLWASAYAGIRAALRAYGPSHLALLRFLVASGVIAIYASVAHLRRPRARDVPGLVFTGAIGISFYNLALNYGETRVSAGAASLLIASTPIWTALLAALKLGERLNWLGWCGVGASFGGVALIASAEGEGIRLSVQALVILAAAIASALYIVLQKQFLERYSALEFTAYSIWAGTLLMLPLGSGLARAIMSAPRQGTVAAIYLGVFPAAIAYVAWAYVLSHGAAGRTASFLYLTPVMAILVAWVWLGEIPRTLSLLGGVLALAGVVVVNLWGHPGLARPRAISTTSRSQIMDKGL